MAVKVIFKKVLNPSFDEIDRIVKYIIEESGLGIHKIGNYCLLKINAMSREVLPGRNTSPWVLAAALKNLIDKFPNTKFIVGDCDVAGYPQFYDACQNWGYNGIARRYNVKIVKLSDDEFITKNIDNPICPIIEFPKTVLAVDSIINIPVINTHVLSGITCCLKNHWGLLPKFRYQYHPYVSEVIMEINRQIEKTVLNIVDGTICMEGSGPKTGIPKICSVIFAGIDRVAVDSAVSAFMGFSPDLAPHISLSEKKAIGPSKYEIVGDKFEQNSFQPPNLEKDIVSYIEKYLKRIPVVGELLYSRNIARMLGLIGTKFNELVWFNIYGKKYRKIVYNTPYESEFKRLFK